MKNINKLEIKKRGRSFAVISSDMTRNFWEQLRNDNWEEGTFSILDRFVTSQVRYIDIGCWVGPTVLYAAQRAKITYAFEPDPIAFNEMVANLKINSSKSWASKIILFNKAVAPQTGKLVLGSRGSGGDSTSSVLFANQKMQWLVEAISLPDFLERMQPFSGKTFIKLDIEGGEFTLMPAIKNQFRTEDVILYISIHTNFLADALSRKSSFLGKVNKRLALTYQHWKLCNSLKFRYFYSSEGTPVNIIIALVFVFFTGKFPMEILATNVKLSSDFSVLK